MMIFRIWLLTQFVHIAASHAQTGFNVAREVGFPFTEFTDFIIDNDTIVGYGLGLDSGDVWRPGLVLSKFDTLGNLLLSRIILHSPGDYYNIGKAWGKIIKTADGGYAMTAAPFYSNSAVLIKTDENFEVEFIKEYPDTVNLSNYFYKLVETPEGYLLYGAIQRPDYYDDGFIRYVDKQGETVWFKYLEYSPYSTTIIDVKAMADLTYLASIVTTSNMAENKGVTSLLRFNLEGEELKYWQTPVEPEIGYNRKIINIDTVGILLFGVYPANQNGNALLVQPTLSKLDSNFQTEWVSHFGRISSLSASVMLWDFAPTLDGHYIGAGETLVKEGNDPTRRVGWLYKFSASGDSIWERKIDAPFLPLYYGNTGFFAGVGVLSSGSIVAGGTANEGNTDYCWLVKVTSDGCLDTLFCRPVSTAAQPGPVPAGVALYPNPARDVLQIAYAGGGTGGQVRLFDLQGRLRREIRLSPGSSLATLPVGDLPAGLYVAQWFCNGRSGSAKVIVSR